MSTQDEDQLERMLKACEQHVKNLQNMLAQYAGWSPHQFTELLEKHRELQKAYVVLDSMHANLVLQLKSAKGQVSALAIDSVVSDMSRDAFKDERDKLAAQVEELLVQRRQAQRLYEITFDNQTRWMEKHDALNKERDELRKALAEAKELLQTAFDVLTITEGECDADWVKRSEKLLAGTEQARSQDEVSNPTNR